MTQPAHPTKKMMTEIQDFESGHTGHNWPQGWPRIDVYNYSNNKLLCTYYLFVAVVAGTYPFLEETGYLTSVNSR
jgi:hypothetical protein